MINYLTSDFYRLRHSRNFYFLSLSCLVLVGAAGLILTFFIRTEENFPYRTDQFYYSNVVSVITLVTIIGSLFSMMLTNNNHSIIGQSISFGTSRKTIFWSKWLLTLAAFISLCLAAGLLMIALGTALLEPADSAVSNFLVAIFNAAPIILAGFSISYVARLLNMKESYIFLLIILLFEFLGDISGRLLAFSPALKNATDYFPDQLLAQNYTNYLANNNQLEITYWLVGGAITIVVLLAGFSKFNKQDI